jgi:ParB family transcriptional regulator, chromosome partitioning protein
MSTGALVLEKRTKVDQSQVTHLPMSEVWADEDFNCRGQIIPLDVIDLANNIKENGLIQPIIVQPYDKGPPGTKYRVVAGYRRHKAHQVNEAQFIDCIIRTDLDDANAKLLNLSENLNRQDLNLLQEAKALQQIGMFKLTQQEIANKLNVSRTWVQTRLYVLRLPPEIQKEVEAGWIKVEHVYALQNLPVERQLEEVKAIKEVRQSEGKRVRVATSKKKIRKNPHDKMKRDPAQVNKMLEHILDSVGANFGTRCLAWANGNISTYELSMDVKKIADELDEHYVVLQKDL